MCEGLAEPIYVYRKGEGWVPIKPDQKWAVMFFDVFYGTWRNAEHGGVHYGYDQARKVFEGRVARNNGKRYELWEAEREVIHNAAHDLT